MEERRAVRLLADHSALQEVRDDEVERAGGFNAVVEFLIESIKFADKDALYAAAFGNVVTGPLTVGESVAAAGSVASVLTVAGEGTEAGFQVQRTGLSADSRVFSVGLGGNGDLIVRPLDDDGSTTAQSWRLLRTGQMLVGTTSAGNATAGGARFTGVVQVDAPILMDWLHIGEAGSNRFAQFRDRSSDVGTPTSSRARLYVHDGGSGQSLRIRFANGAIRTIIDDT